MDEAGKGQFLAGLADGRAGDAEAGRKLHLVEPFAIADGAVEDHSFDFLGNDIGAFSLHGIFLAAFAKCRKGIFVYKNVD